MGHAHCVDLRKSVVNSLRLSQRRVRLELGDVPGDVDLFRADVHAVEDRVAPPQAVLIVEHVEAFGRALVAAVDTKGSRTRAR